MKTITLKQFIAFGPCWIHEDGGLDRLKAIAKKQKNWSALDILRLDDVPAEDKLWAVLREELIDAPILHEFACRCAERALALIGQPDPRKWLSGEITDAELAAAGDAASAAAWAAAWDVAGDAAWAAAWDADWGSAWAVAKDAARDDQVKLLINLLEHGT